MSENKNFVFGKDNYTFIIGGFFITLIGFLLMMGGASEDPNVFEVDEIFSHTRITLAPFLVITGYVIVIYGIMKKRKSSK
jgi:hypothetical protein